MAACGVFLLIILCWWAAIFLPRKVMSWLSKSKTKPGKEAPASIFEEDIVLVIFVVLIAMVWIWIAAWIVVDPLG